MTLDQTLVMSSLAVGTDTGKAGMPTDVTQCIGPNDSPKVPVVKSAPRFVVGDVLGKYQITAFIGRGGMGEVYRGFDPLIERDVALKVIPAELMTNAEMLRRFLAEARAVGKFIHPNSVALHEIGQEKGLYFLAMEYVPGGAVSDRLEKLGSLDLKTAGKWIFEVCQGLAAAHQAGLIHRDIKPENLLLTADDRIKITDFGLAKASNDTRKELERTQPGQLLGTPFYMSPEQFSGEAVDARSDIYSVGATLYHFITGWRPFSEATTIMQMMYSHCQKPIPDPRVIKPEIPMGFVEMIRKAMAKNPAERYQTCNEMAYAITQLLSHPSSFTPTKLVKPPVVPAPTPILTHMPVTVRSGFTPPSIWLLEPSKVQSMILKDNLKNLGIDSIRTFSTVAEVMAAGTQKMPHGFITTMYLDDGTGEQAAVQLRNLPKGDSVTCYLIHSGSVCTEATPELLNMKLLRKPVTKDMLATVVAELAGKMSK
ncbi:serine/threonine-protein kinase [Zavarzinella formosa]|uniref:serine/threonine-protein kinase n=1 Tax=Zavarzinella formosa TaxID=360055 RepID=UPI0002EC8229|nr:serine/threonine-protein kinase [Zavarzinella formosa]